MSVPAAERFEATLGEPPHAFAATTDDGHGPVGRLPDGFRVRLAPDILTLNHGAVLVGGSPLMAMRLSRQACNAIQASEEHRQVVVVSDQASAHLCDRLLATNLGIPDLEETRPADPRQLTVVIPVRDRPEQLDRALASLTGLQCVVVDDASFQAPRVAEVARRLGARYLPLEVNVGPAGARNVGLSQVTTEFVAFVDSDIEVTALDLLRLTRHFADPRVSLVGPRVVGISRSTRPRWFERFDEQASSLTLGRTPASVRPGAAVAWLPGACLVARTSALEDGFDTTFRVGEDVDLVWRLVDRGHRVRYDPTVQARHDTRSTVRGWLGRKAFYGTGSALLGSRHGDAIAPAVLTPAYAIAAAAVLTRRPAAVAVAAAATAAGTRAVRNSLPDVDGRTRAASRIAVRGFGWALRQETSLLLRHWWPAAAVGAVVSRDVRRAVTTAMLIDTALLLHDHVICGSRPRPSSLLARRLDDLAYGAGLWWGSLRTHSLRALAPRRPVRTPTMPRPAREDVCSGVASHGPAV